MCVCVGCVQRRASDYLLLYLDALDVLLEKVELFLQLFQLLLTEPETTDKYLRRAARWRQEKKKKKEQYLSLVSSCFFKELHEDLSLSCLGFLVDRQRQNTSSHTAASDGPKYCFFRPLTLFSFND